MPKEESNIIIYNSVDGRASVVLYARDGSVWMNQNQLAELFDTSIPNISMHIANVLLDGELEQDSVVKNFFTTAAEADEQDRKVLNASDDETLVALQKEVHDRKI